MAFVESGMKWPNGARCAAMLTFDIDGETLFIEGPEGADWFWPRSVSFGRFGPNRGAWEILKLLDKYGIKATFFVPGRTAERYPDLIKAIDAAGHEIGCHGYDHELFADYSIEEQNEIIDRAQAEIGQHTGKKFLGFRAPTGDPTPDTVDLLEKKGFIYSSIFRGDDIPHYVEYDGKRSNIVEIEMKWELDDYVQYAYDFYPALPAGLDRVAGYHGTLENWKTEFDGYYRYGSYFDLVCHPQISGTPGRLELLEELIQHILSYGDVWFATCGEVAAWCRDNNL